MSDYHKGRYWGNRHDTFRVPKVVRACFNCFKAFYCYPSNVRQPGQGRYCSRPCMHNDTRDRKGVKGESNKNWIDGRSSYRQRALAHYGESCQKCGYSEYPALLDVHHKSGTRDDHSLENLEVLCVRCHAENHYLETGVRIIPNYRKKSALTRKRTPDNKRWASA